jgi:hypothetical protein
MRPLRYLKGRTPSPVPAEARQLAVEVDEGGTAHTMKFLVDKNTQMQAQVKVGTKVTVAYQVMEDGENLALNVVVQAY